MKTFQKMLVLLALSPSAAFAHGQQVLALPVGQAVALVVVITAACVLRISGILRAVLVVLAISAMVLTWFVPDPVSLIGGRFEDSGPWFIVGLVPPLVVVGLMLVALVYKRKRPNQTSEPTAPSGRGSS